MFGKDPPISIPLAPKANQDYSTSKMAQRYFSGATDS